MSRNRSLRSPRGQLILPLMHSFNVAALCALGVWHGYVFWARHAAPELKLVSMAACTPCTGAHPGPARAPDSSH